MISDDLDAGKALNAAYKIPCSKQVFVILGRGYPLFIGPSGTKIYPDTSQGAGAMIYEKLDLGFDVEKLRDHLRRVVFPLAPVMQGQWFGGWSVLSTNGHYADGWQMGHKCYKIVDGKEVFDAEKAQGLGLKRKIEYMQPTEICSGYLAQVIDKLNELGFMARRARISVLKAEGHSAKHRDASDAEYAVRLHVPIITNPRCVFECEEGSAHFPADGAAYIIRVNRMHQIFNRSLDDRYHLMMDIWDTAGRTEFHALDSFRTTFNILRTVRGED